MFKKTITISGKVPCQMSKKDMTSTIEKLEKELRIRQVDPDWVKREADKLVNNYQGQQYLADYKAREILNSYKPSFSRNGKLSYVLWKANSICEVLMASGYHHCLKANGCKGCPLQQHLQNQVYEILEQVDTPTGNCRQKVEGNTFRDRRTIECGSHKIDVEFCVKVRD